MTKDRKNRKNDRKAWKRLAALMLSLALMFPQAFAAPGQSFGKHDGKNAYSDLAASGRTARIKAFTCDVPFIPGDPESDPSADKGKGI